MTGNGTAGPGFAHPRLHVHSRPFRGLRHEGLPNDAVINRIAIARNVFTEYYLQTIDQAGVEHPGWLWAIPTSKATSAISRARRSRSRRRNCRFVFPLSDRFAFTLEGGMNETMLSRDNTGRVVAGFQFGNFMRPKDYLEGYNGVRHAVPVDVPRVRQ